MDILKKYDLIITKHARERWVERIVDPKRYYHFKICTSNNCEQCCSLIHNVRMAVQIGGRFIDREIVKRFRDARDAKCVVDDRLFLEAICKQQGYYAQYSKFYQNKNVVFVVSQQPHEPIPVLVTVLTADMIEGTIFKAFNPEEIKGAFKSWNFEAKYNSHKIKPV